MMCDACSSAFGGGGVVAQVMYDGTIQVSFLLVFFFFFFTAVSLVGQVHCVPS